MSDFGPSDLMDPYNLWSSDLLGCARAWQGDRKKLAAAEKEVADADHMIACSAEMTNLMK